MLEALERLLNAILAAIRPKLFVTEQLRAFDATAGAFAANDAVGAVIVFDVPRRGRILSATAVDQADATSLLTAHIYSRAFVAAASNAAYTISAADAAFWVANPVFSVMNDEGSAKVGDVVDIDKEYYSPTGQLFVQFSTTGTPTFTAVNMPLLQLAIFPMEP